MMRLYTIFIIVQYSLILTINVAQAASMSKPGCPEKCGNITIPYPFGIGMECSADIPYTIICNNTFNPPKPFLMVMSLEVVQVSLDENVVGVMHGVSPLNCSSQPRWMQLGKPTAGWPFTFSALYNRLVVVGCKNVVSMVPSYGACNPICGSTTDGCNGINCCQTTIPPRLKELELVYRSSDSEENNASSTNCGYAFMADQRWLVNDYRNTSFQNYSVETMEYVNVPMMLEWEFDTSGVVNLQGVTCERRESYSPSLDRNGNYSVTRCSCRTGFEGNPYLPGPGGGCQDIDECSNTTLRRCIIGTCINTVGSFTCEEDLDDVVSNRSQTKTIVIGVSSGIGALLLLTGAWISTKVVRKRVKASRRRNFFKRNGGLLLADQLSSNDGGVEKIKLFNSKELAQATDHYNENRILGRGGQGTVYKGMLTDGRIVAVKKSKKVDEADIQVFVNEVVILSQINHRNIVKLLGCCLETQVPLLVYEFIPNGTLFQHIHDQNDEFPLSWKMRLRIATEAAGALSYLHYAASVPIYHRDIKSTNILLDHKYRAKVSDFGTSRSIAIDQTHLTTKVLGTFGYLDPEYFQSSQFTEKSDVYSFGVVMVELLTGEKAISAVRSDEVGRSLATHFLHSMEENRLFDILDAEVVKESRTEEIAAVAELARRCLNLNGKKRPTMKQVAVELERIQMLKEGSVLQSNHEDTEFHSIEIYGDYDFSSISDSTNSNVITAESSESPLLFGNS